MLVCMNMHVYFDIYILYVQKNPFRGTVESNGILTQFGILGIQKKVLIVDGYFEGSPLYPDGWKLVSVYVVKALRFGPHCTMSRGHPVATP